MTTTLPAPPKVMNLDDIARRRKEIEAVFGSEDRLRERRSRNENLTADEIVILLELDNYYYFEHGEWPDYD